MERRLFLKTTAAGALALGLPQVICAGESNSIGTLLISSESLRLLGEANVRSIGQRYLSVRPDERDPDRLTERILSNLRPGLDSHHSRGRSTVAAFEIANALRRRVVEDFATRRTIRLDGWVLSITEARQCALFVLLS